MSSLRSLVARGCLRSRSPYRLLPAVYARPIQQQSGIATATLSTDRDAGLLPNPNAQTPQSATLEINQERIFGAVKENPFAMRLPEPAAAEPFRVSRPCHSASF
jgi:hypothetical protein